MQRFDEGVAMRYCKKHAKPLQMFPCKIFHGVTVGHYCVSCYSFVPVDNPELNLLRKLLVKQS